MSSAYLGRIFGYFEWQFSGPYIHDHRKIPKQTISE